MQTFLLLIHFWSERLAITHKSMLLSCYLIILVSSKSKITPARILLGTHIDEYNVATQAESFLLRFSV